MDIWDKVVEQVRKDVWAGEVEALYEMLQRVPKDVLIAYLPEEESADV